MATSRITLSPGDALDFARLTLSEVATRAPSKHQKAPFVSSHMARQTEPKYLRGSDLSERLYVSVEVLKHAGHSAKEALVTVADLAKTYLGSSSRGRPRLEATRPDVMSVVETVRSMVNAFARRKRFTDTVVDWRVGQFLWARQIGAIDGSEFVPDFGRKMHSAKMEALREFRRRYGLR